MPTPVAAARECLASAAAAVLDDAVAIARRRGHAQSTSLHAVSALLALPSSALREACVRARSSAYVPRLQFRALELCVGVALDRVSASKSSAVVDEPPISNSLMAAIKRSQANQRRHPETFHLYQQQQQLGSNLPSISAVKVELKHFVISILDDPMVSRVFGDAGFRTHDIKLAILNPITISRFSAAPNRTPPPPLFSCSLREFEPHKHYPSNFPFLDDEKLNANSSRIGEILLNQSGSRNPLLVGICANDAYRNFIDSLKGGEADVLPKEIAGLKLKVAEVSDSITSEETVRLKLNQVNEMLEDCHGGTLVSCGDLKALVDAEPASAADAMVAEVKSLLSKPGAKLWLIGYLASDSDYKKLVERFPCIVMGWGLHLLTITTTSTVGKCFTSSLMRSFVPFGGFFPMPSEFERSSAIQSSKLCDSCNEKCTQEVNAVLKGFTTNPMVDKQLVNPSTCLQISECETSKRPHSRVQVNEDEALSDARVVGLQKKWRDICRRLHCSWKSQGDTTLAALPASSGKSLQNVSIVRDARCMGLTVNGDRITSSSTHLAPDMLNNHVTQESIHNHHVLRTAVNVQVEMPIHRSEMSDVQNPSISQKNLNTFVAPASSPSALLVPTDLRLGAFYDSNVELRRKPYLRECNSGTQNSGSSRSYERSCSQLSESSLCSRDHEKHGSIKNLEHPWNVLAQRFYWQTEAIQSISLAVARSRNGKESQHFSNNGNVWLSFLGPDKVGKRKVAASIAEVVFGRNTHFLHLDLNSQDMNSRANSVVDCYGSKCRSRKSGRKIMVDFLADELRKLPHSVVLLEHVEKADFLVQQSLSQAVKTGKFSDSCGRDININNNVFVLASSVIKGGEHPLTEFPEQKILEAKSLPMQLVVESCPGINRGSRCNGMNVRVTPSKLAYQCPLNKRKWNEGSTSADTPKRGSCFSRSTIDLNLPVEDTEENSDSDKSEDDDRSSDNSVRWLEELLEHVDENIVFKPFDFDSLNQKILKEMDVQLKKTIGEKSSSLEIHQAVMAQILAAAWMADHEAALEDWIETVLCPSIDAAWRKWDARLGDMVMKLMPMPCDGEEAQVTSGVWLPAKINVK